MVLLQEGQGQREDMEKAGPLAQGECGQAEEAEREKEIYSAHIGL